MSKKIVIDPGHGGSDPGAIGNNIIEKDLNIEISKYENEYGKNSSLSSFAHSYANDVYENENPNY